MQGVSVCQGFRARFPISPDITALTERPHLTADFGMLREAEEYQRLADVHIKRETFCELRCRTRSSDAHVLAFYDLFALASPGRKLAWRELTQPPRDVNPLESLVSVSSNSTGQHPSRHYVACYRASWRTATNSHSASHGPRFCGVSHRHAPNFHA